MSVSRVPFLQCLVHLFHSQERIKRLAKRGITVRTKEEKRQMRRLKEKEKRMKKKRRLRKKLMTEDGEWQEERAKDFEDLEDGREGAGFNEVAMQPPSLKSASKIRGVARDDQKVGKNKNLLLSKKLKSGKPQVSMARKQILEDERLRVIEEYRNLKLGGRVSKVKL